MKRTAKLEYACRALLALSLHWPNENPLQVGEIAEGQEVPVKFLVHILIELKQLGLVKSVRGKSGGYLLNRRPKDIRLSEVVQHFGSRLGSENENMFAYPSNAMSEIWQEVETALMKFLNTITFEEIANRAKKHEKILMYEI